MSMELGAQIKSARLRAGLTQSGLSEILGVSSQTVHRWEAGKSAVPAGRLADIALATGQAMPTLLARAAQPRPTPESLERAKSGDLMSWWGDVIITFKGNAPSIARALSEHGHQDFYRTCLTHTHFFSFIDMAGRLLIVNRSKVERLMLLDEADDRAPDELLQAGHDRPPNNPLAAFFEHQGCGFNTGHETDRALQIVAELYMEGAFTKEALAKVQASEPHSQLAAGIAEVGVLRLAHIGELLSKSSNPYFVAEQLGGRLVDVHLASGLSRTVTLSEGDYQYLFIDGDLLEDGATGGSLGVLQAEEEGLVEFFNWQDIAWVETSALSAHEAFQEEMDLLGEG